MEEAAYHLIGALIHAPRVCWTLQSIMRYHKLITFETIVVHMLKSQEDTISRKVQAA